jgi:menaquinone-dependent protoporphyrinogen oxidase
MPAGRELLPEGDFRDWAEIESWAGEIARELAGPLVGHAPGAAE